MRLHPDAFGSACEVEAAEPASEFAASIAKGGLFGGFLDDRLLGMAGFSVHGAARLRHKGTLGGRYVREAARGSGLAEAIVNTVLEHAAGRVEQVYERLGFKACATQPRALKVGPRYVDELLKVRFRIA